VGCGVDLCELGLIPADVIRSHQTEIWGVWKTAEHFILR